MAAKLCVTGELRVIRSSRLERTDSPAHFWWQQCRSTAIENEKTTSCLEDRVVLVSFFFSNVVSLIFFPHVVQAHPAGSQRPEGRQTASSGWTETTLHISPKLLERDKRERNLLLRGSPNSSRGLKGKV